MSLMLNQAAAIQVLEEDLAWLRSLPSTLEREHIEIVLKNRIREIAAGSYIARALPILASIASAAMDIIEQRTVVLEQQQQVIPPVDLPHALPAMLLSIMEAVHRIDAFDPNSIEQTFLRIGGVACVGLDRLNAARCGELERRAQVTVLDANLLSSLEKLRRGLTS